MPKPSLAGRLKKANDKLWSEIVRRRDGKCLVCGTTEKLHAHHAIVRKKISLDTRWHLGNGVALCYRDHMIKLHRDGDAEFLRDYLQKLDARIPYDFQQEMIAAAKQGQLERNSNGTLQDEITVLEAVNKSLSRVLADMREKVNND